MGVLNGKMEIEYLFKDKKIEISVTKDGSVNHDTIMIKNLSHAKTNKNGIAIYLNSGEMYYIDNSEFIDGDRLTLINLLTKNNVKIK